MWCHSSERTAGINFMWCFWKQQQQQHHLQKASVNWVRLNVLLYNLSLVTGLFFLFKSIHFGAYSFISSQMLENPYFLYTHACDVTRLAWQWSLLTSNWNSSKKGSLQRHLLPTEPCCLFMLSSQMMSRVWIKHRV